MNRRQFLSAIIAAPVVAAIAPLRTPPPMTMEQFRELILRPAMVQLFSDMDAQLWPGMDVKFVAVL